MHAPSSPLPRPRPGKWAVINGETETGATLHYMVEKPDAGDMWTRRGRPSNHRYRAGCLSKVTEAACASLCALALLLSGKANRTSMDLAAGCYFGGRRPADGLINWGGCAEEIYNLVRGVTHPYPGHSLFWTEEGLFMEGLARFREGGRVRSSPNGH